MPEAAELPLVTELPESFVREFRAEIEGTIPQEKVQVELRQQMGARIAAQMGSVRAEGLGQKIASIDGRLFFRMRQAFGHEDNWLNDFLADNPALCCPGYRPKSDPRRKGFTYSGGKPISRPK